MDSDKCAKYSVTITDIPASFVTPLLWECRRYLEDKSDWKDFDDVSKIVDKCFTFKKLED